RNARINADKVALLRSAANVVSNADAVGPAVVRALSNPDERSERRASIARDLFYRPGGATVRAARCIYELLELAAPAHDAAAVERLGSHERQPLDQIVLSSPRTPRSARSVAIDGTSVPKQ